MAEPRYKYGGENALAAFFMPERREILSPEESQIIGYRPSGEAIVQNIPAQYGESEIDFSYTPVVRGARSAASFLNDLFLGDANEQSEAAGKAVSAVRGIIEGLGDYAVDQYEAGMAGGTTYNPETGQITDFDPALVMGGAGASRSLSKVPLDMSSSARMQRAQDLGFNTDRPLYHYTDKLENGGEFNQLSISPENVQTKLGRGIYTSPDNEYGDRYIRKKRDMSGAYDENARAMSLYARGNIATETDYDEAYRAATKNLNIARGRAPDIETKIRIRNDIQNETQRLLKNQGFSGVQFMDEVMVFDPKDVRSVNARFDPAMSSSDMILYSGGGRQGSTIAGGSALRESFRIGDEGFDSRFDNRAKEQQRILDTDLTYEGSPIVRPEVSIFDYEGKPFRITMADRTKAGSRITGVEGVDYDLPVELQGGQDFMFANPVGREGQVWAQDRGATSAFINSFMGLDGKPIADEILMLPYRMAPSGGDFSTMTGEVMVTHARNAVSKKAKQQADKTIKEFYPAWKGIDNPESIDQIREMKGNPRKSLLQVMDRDLRNEGGLGIGQARLAVTDRAQYNAPDFNLQNVGVANPYGDTRFEVSGHRTYGQGLAGRPEGILREQDINVFELMPDLVSARGFDSVDSLLRADPATLAKEQYTLRRGTRGGVITEEMLRDIEARRAQ